jgi:hypothetical protein
MVQPSALQLQKNTSPQSGLGDGIARYSSSLRAWRVGLFLLMIWVLVLLLIAGFAAGFITTQLIRSDTTSGDPRIFLSLVLFLGFTLLFWLYLLVRYRQSGYFLEVFQHGIQFDLPGSGRKCLRWDEIDAISVEVVAARFFGLQGRPRWRAWLYPRQGKTVELDPIIDKLPEAISRLKAATYPNRLKNYRLAYSSGQFIRFGPLIIHPDHLLLERKILPQKTIPWTEVALMKIENGRLIVTLTRGPHYRVPVKRIPNMELFLEIVKQDIHL